MEEKLKNLYAALSEVETKGNSTRTMASCLAFIESMISEASQKNTTEPSTPSNGPIKDSEE